jgi:hypothetical protein
MSNASGTNEGMIFRDEEEKGGSCPFIYFREGTLMRTMSGNGASSKSAPAAVGGSKSASEVRKYTPEEWHEMVATAAYFLAERRGFTAGSEENDWLLAEAELQS